MNGSELTTQDILLRLSAAAKKIDELSTRLYLLDDQKAAELSFATQLSLRQLQKNIKKQFLYLENRYISLLDDASISVRASINSRRFTVSFSPDRAGDFLCYKSTLLYYDVKQPLYFNSQKIRNIPKGTLEFEISITCSSKPPTFWVFASANRGETIKTSQLLENGINKFKLRVSPNASNAVFALRFLGKGSCRINHINIERSSLELYESFPRLPKEIKSLKIASVLDELSEAALTPSARFLPLQKGDYKKQLKEFAPDFLLVESCWNGNGIFGAFNSENHGETKLAPLLQVCQELQIPTVFWNKEDPWHYEGFINTASLFDYIFTTDANMIPRYKADISRAAHCLPFAAQPSLHYPNGGKNNKAFFAGTWYADKNERCADFLEIDRMLNEHKIEYDIFDRCQGKGITRYVWPELFQKRILGQLTPLEVFQQSRNYKFQINVNSVKSSPTMFSRRVFESMAAGAPVIGNYAEGVERTFPGLTIMFGNGRNDSELLRNLNEDQRAYDEYREKGILAVMREHTYEKRLEEICRVIGIEAQAKAPAVTMAFDAASYEEAALAEFNFNKQTWKNKKLLIRLRPFDKYYQFLNKNTAQRRYVLASEDHEGESEGGGLMLQCDPAYEYPDVWAELQIYANPGTRL